MKVLHVYKDYPPVLGGIEHHVQTLAEGQARRGLEVTVLVTSPGRRTTVSTENGVEVIRAGRLGSLASTPLSLALPARLRRQRPDIAHLQFPYPVGELAQLALGRSRATVLTYQSDIVRQRRLARLYRPLMRCLLHRTDRILVTSPRYRDSSPILGPLARRDPNRFRVIPLGIDTERFAQSDPERVAHWRQRWPGPRVLFVGRLRYYKGLADLIAAATLFEATVLIAGRGPLEDELHRLARASPAAERIVFLGDVDDLELPALYQAADVFVLPSSHRSEAYGLAQLEAMAAGTPAVSTELGTGTSFVNQHGETGLVVPAGSPAELAQAVRGLLEDPALRRRLGSQAQARAARELDAEQMIDRVVEAYDEVLEPSRRRLAKPL